MVVLFDDVFEGTGWRPKCYRASAPASRRARILLESRGDPWDRFVSLIANKVEVLRAFTPFDGRLEQEIELPEGLGAALALGCEVCGVVTTYVGGWRYRAEVLEHFSPSARPVPVFTLESVEPGRTALEARLPQRVFARRGYLYATGHAGEEGAVGRRFRVLVDGRVVLDRELDWGWYPGCGCVKPYEFDVGASVGSVRLECPSCGRYWKVSLALEVPGGVAPWWLAPAAAGVFALSFGAAYLRARRV